MSLVVQIPRTNSACLFINAKNVEELSSIPEEQLVSRIYEAFSYVASAFAYRELFDSGKFSKDVVSGMFKIETQGLYEEDFDDVHGFDEAMRELVASDAFKDRNKLLFDGIRKELISLFVSGALALANGEADEDEEEILLLERVDIVPPRITA